MKIKRWIGWAGFVLAGLIVVCPKAGADVYQPKSATHSNIPPIKSAEDAVDSIPVLSKIPHSFIVGDGFKVKLTGMEMRIDHMADHSRAPISRRNCMISLSVASPIAFFGSSMELPLFNSTNVSSGWSASSMGDYVLHFSKDAAVTSPTLGLSVAARF